MPSSDVHPLSSSNHPDLQNIAAAVEVQAQQAQGDIIQLLALLRFLEELHRNIRDDLFQEALPTNRQALYNLLREIEAEGGWPYIPRMRLQKLCQSLEASADESPAS